MPRDGVLLLLDRDGTLMDDVGYPNDPATVRLVPNAADAIRELVGQGFVPAVVSNQSGIARGRISRAEAAAVHDRFVALFEAESGVRLPCFYCPHGPEDGCACRKPRTGLLREAATALELTGCPSVMVGDKLSDVDAGRRFGARTVLLDRARVGPAPASGPEMLARDWVEIVRLLQAKERPHVGH